jgi:hypothetical protein
MTANLRKNFGKALAILEETGLLLVNGCEIPDVCRIVTGERMKGSWWSHPAGHEIFSLNELLADHPDVTVAKLISGKVTFVHRKLWQRLVAIGIARNHWQMRNLSTSAHNLLETLDQHGTLFTNKLGSSIGPKPGDTTRELELKLLIHADQIHTEKGAHAKVLETWPVWANRVSLKKKPSLGANTACRSFEKRLNEINEKFGGGGRLPWQSRGK